MKINDNAKNTFGFYMSDFFKEFYLLRRLKN